MKTLTHVTTVLSLIAPCAHLALVRQMDRKVARDDELSDSDDEDNRRNEQSEAPENSHETNEASSAKSAAPTTSDQQSELEVNVEDNMQEDPVDDKDV